MKNPNEYTDEEIYEMLRPKFERANLQTNTIRTLDGKNDMTLNEYWHNGNKTYQTSNQVKQAIALAYKSGYLRAQKGRSFIVGEKKEEKPNLEYRDGALVKFLGSSIINESHFGKYFPNVGTVGKVIQGNLIDWGKDSNTIERNDGSHCWYCDRGSLEVIG